MSTVTPHSGHAPDGMTGRSTALLDSLTHECSNRIGTQGANVENGTVAAHGSGSHDRDSRVHIVGRYLSALRESDSDKIAEIGHCALLATRLIDLPGMVHVVPDIRFVRPS